MSFDSVKQFFEDFGMDSRVMEFDVSSATVELAAQALGCEPAKIAKTLSFMLKGEPILIVFAGKTRVDNAKYKARFGTKATMLTPDELVQLVGHAVGGVCPFAIKDGVTVFLDESLRQFETVFPACGSGNSAIELTIEELERYSGSVAWVDVGK